MSGWTPVRLLRIRIARFWREQFRIWKTAADWTVWLYLLLPGLWIAGGMWLEMLEEPPAWLAALPVNLVLVPLTLAVFTGRLRTFLEDADLLFLLQRGRWIRVLKAGGAVYTFILHIMTTGILFVLLLPWLVLHDAFDAAGLVLLAVHTLACKSLFTAAKRLIAARLRRWRRWNAESLLLVFTLAFYVVPVLAAGGNVAVLSGCAAAGFAAWLLAVITHVRSCGGYEADLKQELNARTALAGMLLTGVIEEKSAPSLKQPLLFHRSSRIFRAEDPGAVLAEMRIKSFARQLRSVRQLTGLAVVSTSALAAVPAWLALGLAAVLPAFAAAWVQRGWREWLEEPYLLQFRWADDDLRRGAALSRFWIVAPAAAWFAAIAGLRFAGWPGLLLAVPAGIGLWMLVNKAMGDLTAVRRREGSGLGRNKEPSGV